VLAAADATRVSAALVGFADDPAATAVPAILDQIYACIAAQRELTTVTVRARRVAARASGW